VGATGVAPDATIMPVRVLGSNGSGSAASVAAGIRYAAANGADIINLSLGGAFSSVIQAAIQYAQQLNVLVVVAAGNESASTPSYPARFSSSLSSVLSVGAYSSSNSRASFSNRVGTSGAVQVDAPGVNVYSTYIDGRYANLSGTSMATPEVAGLAALALSANSNLTAAQLRTLIVNGANRTIAGSDSRGGVNAALTVALAASGQSSASAATATAQAVQSAAAQTIAVRRFIVSSFADAAGSATPSSAASNTADAPSRSLLTSQLRFAEAESDSAADSGIVSRAAHDQALMAYCDADEAELAGSDANVDIYSWLDAHLSAAIGQGRRLASGRPSIDYHMVV
jgi:subtilisin family serine protease